MIISIIAIYSYKLGIPKVQAIYNIISISCVWIWNDNIPAIMLMEGHINLIYAYCEISLTLNYNDYVD